MGWTYVVPFVDLEEGPGDGQEVGPEVGPEVDPGVGPDVDSGVSPGVEPEVGPEVCQCLDVLLGFLSLQTFMCALRALLFPLGLIKEFVPHQHS